MKYLFTLFFLIFTSSLFAQLNSATEYQKSFDVTIDFSQETSEEVSEIDINQLDDQVAKDHFKLTLYFTPSSQKIYTPYTAYQEYIDSANPKPPQS